MAKNGFKAWKLDVISGSGTILNRPKIRNPPPICELLSNDIDHIIMEITPMFDIPSAVYSGARDYQGTVGLVFVGEYPGISTYEKIFHDDEKIWVKKRENLTPEDTAERIFVLEKGINPPRSSLFIKWPRASFRFINDVS